MPLIEKFAHGDRRTIVKHYSKGEHCVNGDLYVIRAAVRIKVTQQLEIQGWRDVQLHMGDGDVMMAPSPSRWSRIRAWFRRLFWRDV